MGNISLVEETKKAMIWMQKNNPIDEEDEGAEECLAENWRYCFPHRTKMIQAHNGDVDEIVRV